MKRVIVLLALVLAFTAVNVSAHDKGDLMLNIEPQIGLAFPYLPLIFEKDMLPGPDFGLRGTVHYYFADFFSLNAGLGYGFNYHWFLTDPYSGLATNSPGFYLVPVIGWFTAIIDMFGAMVHYISSATQNYFFASYINIPVGFRLSLDSFTLGAGAVANIPVFASGRYENKKSSNQWGEDPFDDVITFKFKPNMSWYADIGFDSSGRKKETNGFGMLLRLSGSFDKEVAVPSTPAFKTYSPYKFNFFSISLVFQSAIQLDNLPIGGKQKN